LVKIQHLSKQLSEPSKKHSKELKEDRETETLLDELRNQVQTVSQQNSSLRNKVHYFKTLHEAESRKRTPYGHIPPRINSVSLFNVGQIKTTQTITQYGRNVINSNVEMSW
jgi:predicted RNase H-like nuclease (RuvC/YqgF family)